MAIKVAFRPYRAPDKRACLELFDANCPEFFAPNERDDYHEFLDRSPAGYEVCEGAGGIVGAFGVFEYSPEAVSLNWILLDPAIQGQGIGSEIMRRVGLLAESASASQVHIAASHKSAPFFEKFGARTHSITTDGWGPGMHRVDMQLELVHAARQLKP